MLRALILLGLLLCFPLPSRADVTTGLIGYWSFTGDAQDASGNGNHGTPVNGPTLTTDRHGNPDAAYHFNGIDTRIDIPPSASLDSPDTAITIAAYVRRDGWGMVGFNYNPILTKSISTVNAFQYRLVTTQTGLNTALNSWNTSGTLPYDFAVNVWYHVASTWEADTLKSYVNGQLLATDYVPATLTPDNRTLSIGSDTPGVLEIFYGDIDEVRIYNRALEKNDIAELVDHVSGAPITVGNAGGLVLGRAFPNPLSVATAIPFTIRTGNVVEVDIIDLAGRRVRRLTSGDLPAGPHTVHWDGRDNGGRKVVGGIYLYRVSTPSGADTGKLVLMR